MGTEGTNADRLELLLSTFLELMKLYTSPGEKSHALWNMTDFIKEQIRAELKWQRKP